MATPNYDINYNDPRFTQVNSDETNAKNDINNTYNGMISQSDAHFQQLINAADDWGDKQAEIQNEQTDFAIEKIEQQKEWAEKDYQKEQSGAYVDWQKQSNQYGANAEQNAAQGMANTGYSESSQVAMYNQYQSRVALARESFVRAQTEFTNAMTEARLQNSAALAQIAAETLQKKLELSLQGFQYKNQLITEKTNKLLEVDNMYYQRWQDVLAQINQENALAEDVRQYNETLAENKRQHNESMALDREKLKESKRQFNVSSALESAKFAWQQLQAKKSSSGGSSGGSGGGSGSINKGSSGSSSNGNINKDSGGTKGSTEEITVDMDSVTALGYGPISAQKLADLISQGLVIKYVEDGKYKFRKAAHINTNAKVIGGGANDIHVRR